MPADPKLRPPITPHAARRVLEGPITDFTLRIIRELGIDPHNTDAIRIITNNVAAAVANTVWVLPGLIEHGKENAELAHWWAEVTAFGLSVYRTAKAESES